MILFLNNDPAWKVSHDPVQFVFWSPIGIYGTTCQGSGLNALKTTNIVFNGV